MKKLNALRMALLFAAVMLFSLGLSVSASADYPLWITKDLEEEITRSPGESVFLMVEAVGGSGNISYQWYNSSGIISCTAPYISYNPTVDDLVYCVMRSGNQSVESTHCKVNVGVSPYNSALPVYPPQITTQPKSTSVAPGQSTTLSVQAVCPFLNSGVGLEYQWYSNTTGDMRYARPIEGANFPTYTVPVTYYPGKLYYVCSVHSTNGTDTSQDVLSDIVTVYCGELAITKHPTGESVTAGGKATFIARAEGAAAFEWRIVKNDGSNGFYRVSEAPYYFSGLQVIGADTDTLVLDKIPASMNGMSIICVFYADSARTEFKITNSALLTVKVPYVAPTPTPSAYIPPVVTKSPSPTAAPSKTLLAPSVSLRPEITSSEDGHVVALSVNAIDNNLSGSTLKYQWYRNSKNSNSGGTAIAGAGGASYEPISFSDGKYYYVGVWASDGKVTSKVSYTDPVLVDNSVSSRAVLLAPSISVRPDITVSDGYRTAVLSINAVDNNDSGTELEFQWYRSYRNSNAGGTAIAGATGASYEPIVLNGSRYYYVGVWATDGNTKSKVSYTDPVLLSTASIAPSVLLAPSVSLRPEVTVSEDGKIVSLSVNAIDNNDYATELKYQWYRSKKNSLSGGTAITGAQSASFVNIVPSDSKYYYVAVWATDGNKNSKVAYSGPVLVDG